MASAQTQTGRKPAPLPRVAIVGRPNVGKSQLFNRLVGRRTALVEDLPGTTRDRIYGVSEWRGRRFEVIDTGGPGTNAAGPFAPQVRKQVEQALCEADVILFVVDVREGITAADEEIADLVRAVERPVVVLANKADNQKLAQDAVQFYQLGLGEPLPVSAYHGTGIAELLDMLVELLPPLPQAEIPADRLAIAIVGRPNVGKSALLNAILGEERVIVSEIPGTTRDTIDTLFSFNGHELLLVDTAGIRRRGRIEPGIERHSVLRAERAIERCAVALVIMDATEPATAQDLHIAGTVVEAYKGMVLVLNKMDLLKGIGPTEEELRRVIRTRLRFAPWAPIVFVSAKEGSGIEQLLRTAVRVGEVRSRRVPTAELNRVVHAAVARHAPPAVHGHKLKIFYVAQPEVNPPTFVFFVNDPALLHFSYERYLENALRRAFGFEGTAIRLIFRGRESASC